MRRSLARNRKNGRERETRYLAFIKKGKGNSKIHDDTIARCRYYLDSSNYYTYFMESKKKAEVILEEIEVDTVRPLEDN